MGPHNGRTLANREAKACFEKLHRLITADDDHDDYDDYDDHSSLMMIIIHLWWIIDDDDKVLDDSILQYLQPKIM